MQDEIAIPNLRHLAGVLAVAECGTISEAARRINLSQPALTQGVARIEAALGVALFLRGGAGMHLTEPGEVFARRLRRGLDFLARGAQAAGQANLHRIVTLGQLRCLIAAVEQGGFRPAAAHLGREVSTVSRACREVEQQAGVSLFETTSSGLQPTRQAEELSRLAKLALTEFGQAIYDVKGWQGSFEGRLAIGCLPLVQTSILPEALIRFTPEFPAIAPRVVDGYYASLARGLRRGDLDLLLGALRQGDLPEGLVQTRLFSDPLVVVARPGHPLLEQGEVTVQMLADYPWVAPRQGAPARAYFERLRAEMRVPEGVPQPIETGSHSVLRGVLFGSDRLTLISGSQVRRDLALNLMARVPIDLPDSARDIGVTHREDWLPGLPQARFLEIVREVVAERG